jgi:hypothetical protein
LASHIDFESQILAFLDLKKNQKLKLAFVAKGLEPFYGRFHRPLALLIHH